MRAPIEIASITLRSKKFGEYYVKFYKPAVAKVELISHSMSATSVMYLTTRAYKGIYRSEISEEDMRDYSAEKAFEDIMNTKLQTPLEMVHTLWLLRDVTRAFTHQLVRYRVGTSFVQESMRFFGMQKRFKILVTGDAGITNAIDPPNSDVYIDGCVESVRSYVTLLERGVPDQDARGTLPTNILTNIYFDCSLRTLQGIFPQRLCCQAQQGEWQPILREMREQIRAEMGENIEKLLRAPYERGEDCGYRASFDRPCVWRKHNTALES